MHNIHLICPLTSRIHTLANEVDQTTVQWARTHGLFNSAQAMVKLELMQLGNLAGRTHPYANREGVALIADWCTWFFEHDDLCDDQFPDPQALVALHTPLRAVVQGTILPSQPLERALWDLWHRTIYDAPSAWIQRLSQHLDDFFESKIWEAQQRAQGKSPTLADYVVKRPIASGMKVYIDLIEKSMQTWLSPKSWKILHPLRMLAARTCCWANDIVSFEREKAQGEMLNLVIVLMDEGFDESQAKAQAITIHNCDVQSFMTISERIAQQQGKEISAQSKEIKNYIQCLATCIRGNLEWTSNAARYKIESSNNVAAHANGYVTTPIETMLMDVNTNG